MRHASRSRFRPYLLAALAILTIIYLTTGPSSTQTSEFYTRTVAAMDARQHALREGLGGSASPDETKALHAQAAAEAKVRTGLGEEVVLAKVKEHGDGKGETVSDKVKEVVKDGKDKPKAAADGVTGLKKGDADNEVKNNAETLADADKAGKNKKKVQGKGDEDDGVAKVGNTGKMVKEQKQKGLNAGDKDTEIEILLDGILKKSPIIIFSKSYCPYSKKAKHILLDKYKIVPAPYVHEIDKMEPGDDPENTLATRLQNKLYEMTKRRTVPNVLINAVSIGGGDDVQDLHERNKLADKIVEIGGKRIMEVKKLSD